MPFTISSSRDAQRGQTLVFGLGWLIVIALLMFTVFSVGQVSTTKRRLTDATDAGTYSAALWRARMMNYIAYSNRAMIANEVAIAQTTTIASYAKYVRRLAENVDTVADLFPVAKPYTAAILKVVEAYDGVLDWVATADIAARSGYIQLMALSQKFLAASMTPVVLNAVGTQVIKRADNRFFLTTVPVSSRYRSIVAERSGEDRKQFKELVLESRDDYSAGRNDDLGADGVIHLARRGATEMVRDNDMGAMDRWQAFDTMSLHIFDEEDLPLSWGGAEAGRPATDAMDDLGATSSSNKRDNAMGYRMIEGDDFWSAKWYFGLPAVHELDPDSAGVSSNGRFPVMRVLMRGLLRNEGATGTAQAAGHGKGRVVPKDKWFASELAAASAAEVYFRRPPVQDGKVEYASTYSPYWQARLSSVEPAERLLLLGGGYLESLWGSWGAGEKTK